MSDVHRLVGDDSPASLIVLGSGGPVPNAERFGSAYIIESGTDRVMIDCGPAAVYRMAKLGIHPLDIDHLLLTHHHFDHMADLGTFLMTRWDHSTGSENPLNIYGPKNTEEIFDRLIGDQGAFAFDLHARTEHHLSQTMHSLRGGSLPRPAPRVKVHEVTPGTVLETSVLNATAASTEHVQPFHDSFAYRLDTNNASVVFTGDAQPCDHIVELAGGAESLVSLCGNFQSKLKERGVEQGQTGTLGAAELAAASGVSQLFLVHMSTDLTSERDKAEAEMREIFDGEIVFTDEMESYELTNPRSDSGLRGRTAGEFPHIVRH